MKRIFDILDSLQKFNWNLTRNGKTPENEEKTTIKVTVVDTANRRPEGVAQMHRLNPEGGTMGKRLYDCCAYLIFCPKHGNIAVSRQSESSITWLPFVALPSKRSWNEGALFGSFTVLAGGVLEMFNALKEKTPYTEAYLIDVFRFQLPQTLEFIVRLTYFVKLDPYTTNRQFACCQKNDRIEWIPLSSLQSGIVDRIWGPELVEFSRWASAAGAQRIHVYSLKQAFHYVPRVPPRNLEEAMLKSAGVSEKDVERLYESFIDHCFPAFSMTIWSFNEYMLKHGIETNPQRLVHLFNACNYQKNGYLSFHELLLGLAAIEPSTVHGEARVKFIFRYYDHKNKGLLFENDFRKMVADIHPQLENHEEELEAIVRKCAASFNISEVGGKFGIKYEDFYKVICANQFHKTSELCRAKKPTFATISRSMTNRETRANQATSPQQNKMAGVITKKMHKGTCQRCKERQYSLVPYYPKMNRRQQSIAPRPFRGLLKTSADDFLKLEHPATKLLTLIRNFASKKGTVHHPNGLMSNDSKLLVKLFQEVVTVLLRLLDSKEGKCVEVSSPCFIIGDIHGNLEDLLSMERVIWRALPHGANLLFLGDYVDRGHWGVECALYVLALRTIYPHKVTLLRGNHEIREIQIKYSFEEECRRKYRDEGEAIWTMLNKVFDRLPVAAVLDDAIYCAHGGIPHAVNTIAEIAKQPLDISSPQQDNNVVWEIIWSDPINASQFQQVCDMQGIDPRQTDGFVFNSKRGAAWYFSEEAANRFLATNGLTHIVRAHEVPPFGYTFHFDKKCTTIFSCSHYCGNNNECACLFVNQQSIRVVRIDTQNNAPATDR